MDFSEMPWLITVTSDDGTKTYGPYQMEFATKTQGSLLLRGERAVAWAAQAPDDRRVNDPRTIGV